MSINLVTVCGHNTTMLKHMLNHYKDIVDDIFVVAYLHKKDDGVLEEIKKIVSDIGSDIYNKIVLEPFNWEKVTTLYNETISKNSKSTFLKNLMDSTKSCKRRSSSI